MPDYVSRKKLKKKVLDRWENEGGNLSINTKRSGEPAPKTQAKERSDG